MKNPWIKASERMPSENGSYIIMTESKYGIYTTQRLFIGGSFQSYNEFTNSWEDIPNIVYWMPMPVPPKGYTFDGTFYKKGEKTE